MRSDEVQIVKNQLSLFLTERLAHANLDDVLKGFPIEHINERVPGIEYTPWELLEHLRITQVDIIKFLSDPNYKTPRWPEEYWNHSGKPATEKDWENSLEEFMKGVQRLKDAIEEGDLFKGFTSDPKYTLLREVLIIIDHNSHHLGQMIFFRKYFGKWR